MCDMAGRHRRFRNSILGSPERRPFRSLHIDLEKTARSLGGHCEGGTVGWEMVAGVVVASANVATFIRMIAAAPRSTARLSPRVVAIAPNTRASAPIDK